MIAPCYAEKKGGFTWASAAGSYCKESWMVGQSSVAMMFREWNGKAGGMCRCRNGGADGYLGIREASGLREEGQEGMG